MIIITAASSLAFTSPSTVNVSPPSNKGPLSSNSLVHALIKYAQGDLEKASLHRNTAVFKLLAVLCLSTECRNILWKVRIHQTLCLHLGDRATLKISLKCFYYLYNRR